MTTDALTQLVDDLLRAGVTAEVREGRPSLVYDPDNLRGKSMAERSAAALAEHRDEALELFARRSELVERPKPPAEVNCRKCRALVVIDATTPEDIWRMCGNVGQQERHDQRTGLLTHKYHPPCPWMPRHPEFGPTPLEGWPEDK